MLQSNVLIDSDGAVQLSDVGILDLLDDWRYGNFAPYGEDDDIRLIAPEVLMGESRSPASDVYAFAALALREFDHLVRQ